MNILKTNKSNIYFVLAILIFILASFEDRSSAQEAKSAIINEIRISGESTSDEFIELYNSSDSPIDLGGWSLKKVAKTGTVENIVTNMQGIIPASGYFLIVPRANCGESKTETCYKGTVQADEEYTTNNYLSKDNALQLFDSSGVLIDTVGWGASTVFEGEVYPENPDSVQSLERKITNSLVQDTGNNKNDFLIENVPNPRNSTAIDSGTNDNSNTNSGTQDQNTGSQSETSDQAENTGSNNTSQSSGSGSESRKPEIIITEFLPNPEDSDSDNEFIELYNAGSQKENISSWTLEDKMGKTRIFKIPENTYLVAGEYKAFMSADTKITLNNSGDGIVLKDANGVKQDETPMSGAAAEDVSFTLKEDKSWDWTNKPTPGGKNIMESTLKNTAETKANSTDTEDQEAAKDKTNYDYSDGIIISEILPNPDGADNKLNYEWIELYNESEKEVDLSGWILDDLRKKGSKPYMIKKGTKIASDGYFVLSNEETKIILNNTEDEINLLWPDETVVDSVSYEKPKEGESYTLNEDDDWNWTAEPTPGKKNSASVKSEKATEKAETTEANYEENDDVYGEVKGETTVSSAALEFVETDVESAKKLPRFSEVKISGLVSAPAGIFSDNMFYVSGLQIYSYSKIFSGIKLGDKVELIGKMSEAGGEKRLIVDTPDFIKVLSHDNLLEPKLISTQDVGEKYEGYLALVEGEVAESSGSVFYINDDSGKAKVYIKPETNIKIPALKIGDIVNVTGIVSRTSLGYRILPRFSNDIKVGKTSSASLTDNVQKTDDEKEGKENSIPMYYYGFVLAALVVLIDWGRAKAKK